MNATALTPPLDAIADADSIRIWLARKTVENWAKAVDRFRQWEREEIIRKEPSPDDLSKHREEGAWFIRWTRQLQSLVMDPEFPLPECEAIVSGRLSQLEEAFAMIHDPMTEAEADAILQKTFPMHPELDRLVKAFEAYQSASPEEALRLFALYLSQVEDAASRMKTGKELLDRAVRRQYRRWERAQSRPATMPRKA